MALTTLKVREECTSKGSLNTRGFYLVAKHLITENWLPNSFIDRIEVLKPIPTGPNEDFQVPRGKAGEKSKWEKYSRS